MRISDWSSDVCSSDLHPDQCPVPSAFCPARTPSQLLCRRSIDRHPIRSVRCCCRGASSQGCLHPWRRSPRLYDESRLGPSKNAGVRSEEHTSELQSLMRTSYAVYCLKKKTQIK